MVSLYYVLKNDFDNFNGVKEYDIPDVWLKYLNSIPNKIDEELPTRERSNQTDVKVA